MQLSTCELNWPDIRHVISRSYELNFASPQISVLKPSVWWYLQLVPLGGNLIYIKSWGWVTQDGISALWERDTKELSFSLSLCLSLPPSQERPCEETAVWQPTASQEESPHQNLGMLASSSQTSQSPGLWEIDIFCLSHPIYGMLLWQAQLTDTVDEKKANRISFPKEVLTLCNQGPYQFWALNKFRVT